jgi:protein-S-isoprenylcysteine O-methyltransferase Ste14
LASLLFFAWVERGGALPQVGLELGWPWIQGSHWNLVLRLMWNALAFAIFGLGHTWLAQPGSRAPRPIYMAFTAVSLVLVMGVWQSTGIVVWALPVSWSARGVISLVMFWSFMAAAGFAVSRFGALRFVGLSAASPSVARTPLVTTGIYAWVRHPVYFFTLLAVFVTPWMTLDRLWLGLCTVAYLALAVPIEERKLLAEFGPEYQTYRQRVPAFFPPFKRLLIRRRDEVRRLFYG